MVFNCRRLQRHSHFKAVWKVFASDLNFRCPMKYSGQRDSVRFCMAQIWGCS